MFDNSSNITQSDFSEVCPEVSFGESENFEFEDVVPFHVSADRPQVSVKGKLLKSVGHWQLLGAPDFILSILLRRHLCITGTMRQPLTNANLLATLFWSFCVSIVLKRCSLPLISSIHLVFQFRVLARRGLF